MTTDGFESQHDSQQQSVADLGIDEQTATAQRAFAAADYDRMIRHLEGVSPRLDQRKLAAPTVFVEDERPPDRPTDAELTVQWEEVVEEPGEERREVLRTSLTKHLDSHPNDQRARRRLKLLEDFERQLQFRERAFCEATELYATGDFPGVLNRLDDVPAELHTRNVFALYTHAEDAAAETSALGKALIENVEEPDSEFLSEAIARLKEFPIDPIAVLRNGLPADEFREAIRSIIHFFPSDAQTREMCRGLLESMSPAEVLEGCRELTSAAFSALAANPDVVGKQLGRVLERLPAAPAEEVRRQFPQLCSLDGLLGRKVEELAGWQRFFTAADRYRTLEAMDWRWKDTLLDGGKVTRLNDRAWELAEAAARVIPFSGDRCQRFAELLQHPLRRDLPPFKRAVRKMELFLVTNIWSERPLTRLTAQRLTQATSLVIGLVAVGLALKILHALIVGIGGVAGYAMALFLAVLWSAFGYALSRVM